MPTTIYLLRHGETLFNKQHKTQGWCDSPLTELGIEQARLAGQTYARKGITVDAAYSSSSERCCDTLELMSEAAWGEKIAYERLKALKELNFGAFEGKDQFLEPHDENFSKYYVRFGGEDFDQATLRIERCLLELVERHPGQRILCCTHGGISIQFFMRWREHALIEKPFFENCASYVYEFEKGIFTCTESFPAS